MVRTPDSYTCGRWFDSYLTYIFFSSFCLFVLELYVRVNKFSEMSGRFPLFIGWTSSKQWIMCYSDCAGGESRTGISLLIPSLTLKCFFLFLICSFSATVECANVHVVPKKCFKWYHIITLYSFRNTLGCRKDLFFTTHWWDRWCNPQCAWLPIQRPLFGKNSF